MNIEDRIREIVREEMDSAFTDGPILEVVEEKPAPKSKKKGKKLGDKKRAKAAEKPVETEEVVEETVEDEGPTSEKVLRLMHKVTSKKSLKTVIVIMKSFGAAKHSELKEEDYPEIIAALEAEL